MIRNPSTLKKTHHKTIRWRGEEIMRIEGFSDAVFAFAMTLLVVSLEVPKTFAELKEGFHGMFGFAICFAMLFMIWQEQHLFFRQYYLKDAGTVALNAVLLFTVLFYVYPLKFLFALITQGNEVIEHGETLQRISSLEEIRELMLVYGVGFVFIYAVFFMLYYNAYRQRESIGLNEIECFHTRSNLYKQFVFIGIGLLACLLACFAPGELAGASGFIYALIGPALAFFFSLRRKKMNRLFSKEELEAHQRWLEES